jgi:hypothetical protein
VTCDEREEGDYLPNFASLGKRLCLPDWQLKKNLGLPGVHVMCHTAPSKVLENFIKMRCLALSLKFFLIKSFF